jgi:hypothetical protein
VQEHQVEEFTRMMREDWLKLVEAEGAVPASGPADIDPEGELPCPACGTAAPLVDGACSDCGLHLG